MPEELPIASPVRQSGRHLSPRGFARLTGGDADADERRAAFEHLRRCEACAGQFEALVAAERVLAGEPAGIPAPELDALLPAILGEVQPKKARSPFWLAIPALCVAAAALIAVGIDAGPAASGDVDADDEYTVRGGPHPDSELAFTALCVVEAEPVALEATRAVPAPSCPAGAELVVAIAPAPKAGAAHLVLTDAKGGVHVAEGGSGGIAKLNAAEDEGVPALTIPLDDGVAPGPATLHVSVCQKCELNGLLPPYDDPTPWETRQTLKLTVAPPRGEP